MPRKKVALNGIYPIHISNRSINKEFFPISKEDMWKIMEEQLFFIHYAYGIQIHAFTLMDNHFHLLISDPRLELSNAMRYFMKETTRHTNRISKRINQLWCGRFFRSILQTEIYYLHAYKYTYRNPVEAGLCKYVLDYPYSSLSGLLGKKHVLFPMSDSTLFDMTPEGCIEWLDHCVPKEDWDAVGKALKKSTFKLRKGPTNKKPLNIEYELL